MAALASQPFGSEEPRLTCQALALMLIVICASGLSAQFMLTPDWRTEHADWAKVYRAEDLAAQCTAHERVLVEGLTLTKLPALRAGFKVRALWLVECHVSWASLAEWPAWGTLEELRVERTHQPIADLNKDDPSERDAVSAFGKLKSMRRVYLESVISNENELVSALAQPSLELLVVVDFSPDEGVTRKLAGCRNLRQLRGVSAMDDGKALLTILKACKLQSLDVGGLVEDTPRELLMAIAEHKSLEALWLRGTAIHDNFVPLDAKFFEGLAANTGLKTLYLEAVDFGRIRHDLPYQVSPFVDLPALKHLGLVYPENLNKSWLLLLKDMPLTELLLYYVPLADTDIELVGKCATLARLTMMYTRGLTQECVSHLAGIQGLEALTIDLDLSRESFLALAKLSKLVVLQTGWDPLYSRTGHRDGREWWSCSHRVDLSSVTGLAATDVMQFLARFKVSRRVALIMADTDGLDRASLTTLLAALPGLTYLDLSRSADLPDEAACELFKGRSIDFLAIRVSGGADVSTLVHLRHVRHLRLEGGLYADEEVDVAELRIVTLSLGGELNRAGLMVLTRMKYLNRLELSRHDTDDSLTEKDLEDARKAAPHLTIIRN